MNSIELFTHAVRVTKNNYIAHNNLGFSFYTIGKFNEAIYHYNEALLIKPDYLPAYYNKSVAHFRNGQYNDSFEDYKKIINLMPGYYDIHCKKAVAYFIRGDMIFGCKEAQEACLLGNCELLVWGKSETPRGKPRGVSLTLYVTVLY